MEKILEKINELENNYKNSELIDYRNNNMNDWNRGYYEGLHCALTKIYNYIKDECEQ